MKPALSLVCSWRHAFAATLLAAAPLAHASEVSAVDPRAVAALGRFHPVALASQPRGAAEDREVWLAKVRSLVEAAPPLLQQSILNSRNRGEFQANLALLEQMREGQTRIAANDFVESASRTATMQKVLGDSTNLVYRALSPCRIMDTRSAVPPLQGPIQGNVLKSVPGFVAAGGNWTQYGGANSDCGLANPPGVRIRAVALVVTILNPNFSAFLGIADANDLNTVLGKVALNYTGGQGLSGFYIVPQTAANTIYFAMPAQLQANLIFDVVGYFSDSDATPLDCVTSVVNSGGGVADIGPGQGTTIQSNCSASYTVTGGGCSYFNTDGSVATERTVALHRSARPFDVNAGQFENAWNCTWTNNDPLKTFRVTTRTICCRVGGK